MADGLVGASSFSEAQTPFNSEQLERQLESVPVDIDSEMEDVGADLNASDYCDGLGWCSSSCNCFISELKFFRN